LAIGYTNKKDSSLNCVRNDNCYVIVLIVG
jgi:hypothetical protein